METKNRLLANLDWDVKVQPLFTINDKNSGSKAIMRNDNDAILSIVGNNYNPFLNRELVKLCKSIEKTGNFKTEGYAEFRNGKLILAFIRNNNFNLRLSDLPLEEYLVIGNSHDRSRQMFVGTTQILTRCENQFTSTLHLLDVKHIKNNNINERVIESIKSSYELRRKKLYDSIEALNRKTVNTELVDDLIVYLLQTDKLNGAQTPKKEILNSNRAFDIKKCIEHETKELGNTAFGLFNGVTWYTSHEIKQSTNNFGNSTGLASELNTKALIFCKRITDYSDINNDAIY